MLNEMQRVNERIHELDGIRGTAILLILLWHYVACQIDNVQDGTWLYYLKNSLFLTWSGVDLFFVLSGFLIAGILIDNKGTAEYFKVFYIRRACRILPIYALLFGSFVIVVWSGLLSHISLLRFQWLAQDPMPLWSYLTFTQNIVMGIRGSCGANWLGITWSLAVEEQFYLLFPVAVYLLSRRFLVGMLVLSIFLPPLLRLGIPYSFALINIPTRVDSLAAGAFLAYALREEKIRDVVSQGRAILYFALTGLAVGAALNIWRPGAMGVFTHSWLAIAYSVLIMIVLVHREGVLAVLMRSSVLVFLGRISYGLYMFHQVISGLLHGGLRGASPSITSPSGAIVSSFAVVLSIAVATLSYYTLERYFLRVGHSFKYTRVETNL